MVLGVIGRDGQHVVLHADVDQKGGPGRVIIPSQKMEAAIVWGATANYNSVHPFRVLVVSTSIKVVANSKTLSS